MLNSAVLLGQPLNWDKISWSLFVPIKRRWLYLISDLVFYTCEWMCAWMTALGVYACSQSIGHVQLILEKEVRTSYPKKKKKILNILTGKTIKTNFVCQHFFRFISYISVNPFLLHFVYLLIEMFRLRSGARGVQCHFQNQNSCQRHCMSTLLLLSRA